MKPDWMKRESGELDSTLTRTPAKPLEAEGMLEMLGKLLEEKKAAEKEFRKVKTIWKSWTKEQKAQLAIFEQDKKDIVEHMERLKGEIAEMKKKEKERAAKT